MVHEIESGVIHGFVAEGFEAVAAEFERNFVERGDVGAAFAAVQQGRTLVDLWGGEAAPDRPWQEDSLQVIFSGTKGLVAACMLMLVDRARIDLDQPVARYWPEFAAGGKAGILMREAISHRAGVPGLTLSAPTLADLADPERMEALLAAEPLSKDPRARLCYHPLTIGWICDAIFRRVDGRSVGRFFAEEIARPLSLDIWIGLPELLEPRVGRLELSPEYGPWDAGLTAEQAADPTRRSIWANPPLFPREELPWNTRRWRASEIAGGGAIASARSVARFYACMAQGGELDGVKLLKPESLTAGRREFSRFRDPFIEEPMVFGAMFELQSEKRRMGPPADAFGHTGAGGSVHAAWPCERVGLSYVMNQLRVDPEDLRTRALLRALHAAVVA